MSKIDVTKERWLYIGGSDLKTIMQLDNFKSRYDLLLEKCQLKEPDVVDNEFTQDGHRNEDLIRNYYNKTRFKNDNLEEKQVISDDKIYRYNADGVNSRIVWECKRVGKTTYESISDVRDKENKKYLVQLLKGMELNNKQYGLLTISLRDGDFDETKANELKEFEINIDDFKDILEEINIEVAKFLEDKNKLLENPFITEEELLPVDLTELSNKVIALENQLAEMKKIEAQAKDLKAQLKAAMDKAGTKTWETPNGTKITLVPDGEDKVVKKFNEKLFKDNNLDLWDEYSEEVTQKGKAGYVRITLPKED